MTEAEGFIEEEEEGVQREGLGEGWKATCARPLLMTAVRTHSDSKGNEWDCRVDEVRKEGRRRRAGIGGGKVAARSYAASLEETRECCRWKTRGGQCRSSFLIMVYLPRNTPFVDVCFE